MVRGSAGGVGVLSREECVESNVTVESVLVLEQLFGDIPSRQIKYAQRSQGKVAVRPVCSFHRRIYAHDNA